MSKNQKHNLAALCQATAWAAIFVVAMVAPTLFANPASASETVYIRLIGGKTAIEGSSKDSAHAGWISGASIVAGDLNGDSMADKENIGSQSSGAGAGKVTSSSGAAAGKASTKGSSGRDVATGQASGKRMHKPFVIVREVDKASPILMKACANGEHFPAAEVDVVENGKTVHFKMTDVIISAVNAMTKASSGGDRPMESVSFTYQKIEMTN